MLLPLLKRPRSTFARRELAEKNFKKNDLKNLVKPQHFRLSSPKIPKTLLLQEHAPGMSVISNLLFFK
jgi:hypothetical protein